MPWKEVTTMSSRQEFVHHAKKKHITFSELCKRFNVSRKTGYKWLNRYEESGPQGLCDKARRPHSHPATTPKKMEAIILAARERHPAWGGRKLSAWLKQKGYRDVPSPSTISKKLKKHGYIKPNNYQAETAWQRFEHEGPNDLWQMDFKGHVGMHDGKRCHPLTILDDHSRFSVGLKAMVDTNGEAVKNQLINVFERYGLPLGMNMDNGPPWGSAHTRHTKLSLWLMRLGIRVSFSRPFHPQTNGKDERFHRTLKAELLNYQTFKDNNDAQRHLDIWRHLYNHERPHEALKLKTPITRYKPSLRKYSNNLPPIQYDYDDTIRKVSSAGYISFNRKSWYLGEGFRGMPVAIRQNPKIDDKLAVYFCNTIIKRIDIERELS